MSKIQKTPVGLNCPIAFLEEFSAVDDSEDENEMNNSDPVPTFSEKRNNRKRMFNYLDSHFSGERNNKMNGIGQCVEDVMLKKTRPKEITDFFQSIPGLQECDEEDAEAWMACDTEDC
ncbi:hypothetical protein TNCV_3910971 [Trichonephila clavipes]|nr:hypothetical protein TNCV_3910971 [Trichonephila clavipes]